MCHETILLRERFIGKVVYPKIKSDCALDLFRKPQQRFESIYSPRFTTYRDAHVWLEKELSTRLDATGQIKKVYIPLVTQYISTEENS